MIDIPAIRLEYPLPSVVAANIRLRRAGNELKGCYPFHADRTPSFTIFAGGERFYCFGCGAGGDVLDYVARLYSVGMVEAARILCAGDLPKVALAPLPAALRADRAAEALAIWGSAVPAAQTPAETYLATRGIRMPLPPTIRFLRIPCGKLGPLPCLVAAVQDEAGAVVGLQRTYLRGDGLGKADLPKPKLSLGKVAGGAIRLGEPDASGVVVVCEGLEDGLSLRQELGGPVWVAAGASMLPAMRFPAGTCSIVIGADNDNAGEAAAHKAAHAFTSRGLTVRIIRPLEAFKDFNAELMGRKP